MPSVISKIKNNIKIPTEYYTRTATLAITTAFLYHKILRPYMKTKKKATQEKERKLPTTTQHETAAMDRVFYMQLRKLLSIMIPSVFCRESGLLLCHTATLFMRTFLSIYVAGLEGHVVKFMVRKDPVNFMWMLMRWIAVAVPATFVNSMIRYLESKVALAFRTRLVKYSYDLYFSNDTYYRVSNLDSRLENVDHCLTDDIIAFTQSVAHLYSHITKPMLDILLISISLRSLARKQGSTGYLGKNNYTGFNIWVSLLLS